jgi:cyclin D2
LKVSLNESFFFNFFQDWELLVLQELQWELSSVSPLDYLDQIIARIGLNPDLDLTDLKRRTETILVLAITEYQFSYLHPSLLASTALLISIKYLTETSLEESDEGKQVEEIKNRIFTIAGVQWVSSSPKTITLSVTRLF